MSERLPGTEPTPEIAVELYRSTLGFEDPKVKFRRILEGKPSPYQPVERSPLPPGAYSVSPESITSLPGETISWTVELEMATESSSRRFRWPEIPPEVKEDLLLLVVLGFPAAIAVAKLVTIIGDSLPNPHP